jgi:hypothetical protein
VNNFLCHKKMPLVVGMVLIVPKFKNLRNEYYVSPVTEMVKVRRLCAAANYSLYCGGLQESDRLVRKRERGAHLDGYPGALVAAQVGREQPRQRKDPAMVDVGQRDRLAEGGFASRPFADQARRQLGAAKIHQRPFAAAL